MSTSPANEETTGVKPGNGLRRRRWWLIIGLLLLAGFLLMNGFAYRHATAMTHFVPSGERTPPPEQLTTAQKLGVLFNGVRLPRPENHKSPADFGLIHETVKFPGAQGIPLEGWLVRQPEAKGIVLVFPGYGGAKDSLLPAARIFHDLGFDTLLVDFHGSGGSGGNVTSIGFHEAEDVAAAVAFARKLPGQPSVILYGSSMGAAAILCAIDRFGIAARAIIVECPFDSLLNTTKNRFAAMGLPAFPFAHLLVFWGGEQQHFNGFRHNPAEYARQVHCPALLIQGLRDHRVKVEESLRIFDNLAGPKTLEIFGAFGHGSPVNTQPEEWREKVGAFLSKLPQAGDVKHTRTQ